MPSYESENDEGPRVYQKYFGRTESDGQILVSASTNDNGDTGYPSGFSQWESRHRDLDAFRQSCGFTDRVGVSGIQINVELDGAPFTGERYTELRRERAAKLGLEHSL